ncbi:G-type lectin S-receptor-like serine/threonine-protein kinase SD2-5 [Impatiens glandulifera]|uniref:G-type lectin S-receptor-like serine/threonine-protein kinase SD2-5 n=1 Tax=Impatiens glandulifera TaxID=253017 RepID=UPI001FB07D8F|nr:G-type lectin S-receptor-like serine/threonine-protein kinase SD2-5 [Impatiens glandulifera]
MASNWVISFICFYLLLPQTCLAGVRNIGRVNPGFIATQMSSIADNGLFLFSNSSNFAFGFSNQKNNPTMFQLVVLYMGSNIQTVVWSANRDSLVGNSDEFNFDQNGIARLQIGNTTVWSTDTSGKGVVVMELWDSGNLVLLGTDNVVVWQSFNNPTDSLLQNQNFSDGMRLVSNPSSTNLTYYLELKSGDMMLYAGFKTPQPYWSLSKDSRKTINTAGGEQFDLASIDAGSWNFYNQNSRDLIWQLPIIKNGGDLNGTWVAVLGNDGSISFSNLRAGVSDTKIPLDSCGLPESCDAYLVCSDGNMCRCPQSLSQWNCDRSTMDSSCQKSDSDINNVNLVEVKDATDYFSLGFISPVLKTSLDGCKSSCLANCSCAALFFQNSSGNCFQLDIVGSLRKKTGSNGGFVSFVKVRGQGGGTGNGNGNGNGNGSKHFPYVVIIVAATVFVILGLVYIGYRRFWKKTKFPESPKECSDEDNFLGSLSGMPIRFSYTELQTATDNFSIKLGQGGFGSVYKGVLPDGTRIAVKKLEGLGQGKKEFRAEVSIIGSIHHLHLVKLKGFCAEGSHKLLAYEFMANGSLDKWIFKKNKEDNFLLDWDTRFNIALRTAKGLAYLHEDCDVKIVHCDIKPENVLLDENYNAKVSDFGLAKLMSREQSHVFTTLRGTRGYLAPEWITNYAISEKSDVYSYGMVLLEIIGGRKNYDPKETSDKSHFPSYAFKMMEEGKIRDLFDERMAVKESDERVGVAIKVALWCIQDDMSLRPSMTRVVQMLEGLCPVPNPPVASPMRSRLFSGMFKSMSDGGTSSGTSAPSDQYNSEAYLSAVRLSGPR